MLQLFSKSIIRQTPVCSLGPTAEVTEVHHQHSSVSSSWLLTLKVMRHQFPRLRLHRLWPNLSLARIYDTRQRTRSRSRLIYIFFTRSWFCMYHFHTFQVKLEPPETRLVEPKELIWHPNLLFSPFFLRRQTSFGAGRCTRGRKKK